MQRWAIGAVVLILLVGGIVLGLAPGIFPPEMPHAGLADRALYILILAAVLCLYRIAAGPTSADRIVSVDILGVLIVGVCAIAAIPSGRSWYIDIGIAWALQSFIGALAFSKYLEGKSFDD
ncbi:MAG TPA: cation:proton antiporter [Candidatus Hydrogenedentes bacterium]|nr:cation:proton antiporter [Candidatus Hydrogenedentota bacterium]